MQQLDACQEYIKEPLPVGGRFFYWVGNNAWINACGDKKINAFGDKGIKGINACGDKGI